MGNFKFKVAYTTDPSKINPAIASGTIDEGDLVIINDNGKGSMKFITNKKELIGMDASLSEQEKENIINETLAEADNRYVAIDESQNIIINGNTPLVPEGI